MHNAVLAMLHLANLLAAQKTTIYVATLPPRLFYKATHREKTGCLFTSFGNQIAAKATASPPNYLGNERICKTCPAQVSVGTQNQPISCG